MNILSIKQSYRNLGPNYGVPMWHVDLGFSIKMDADAVLVELARLGIDIGHWVVVRGDISEKGVGVLVEGLKACRLKVEVECSGANKCPAWFTKPDRWIVYWINKGEFNYGALRPRQDVLAYKGDNIQGWLDLTDKVGAIRMLVVDDKNKVWDLVQKSNNIRVFSKKEALEC